MTVRIGKVLFHDWVSLDLYGGRSDTFVFRMSPYHGLPPNDYARVVRAYASPVRKLRRTASFWVQVEGEGSWYLNEVRHSLRGMQIPVAVTGGDNLPHLYDFSFTPWADQRSMPRPPSAQPYLDDGAVSSAELRCLQVLARSDCAYTGEVASLAGLSEIWALATLRKLEKRSLVTGEQCTRYPCWKIHRRGISIALRSWWVPPGWHFRRRKERGKESCKERISSSIGDLSTQGVRKNTSFMRPRKGPGGQMTHVSFTTKMDSNSLPSGKISAYADRHRRTARLWPSWLRRAWPQAEIWSGWCEVTCGKTRPDGLCWGRLNGSETLFWLEVDGGNQSREQLKRQILHRTNQALQFARRSPTRLVFTLLSPPWVWKEAARVYSNIPTDLAVVLSSWTAFGKLPYPEWGGLGWR